MLLLIDAGNTRIKWVAADRARAGAGHWLHEGTLERGEVERLAADWGKLGTITAVCVSNVAGPVLRDQIEAALVQAFGAAVAIEWFVSAPQRAGLRNAYRNAQQLGSDRFAAAIGARRMFPREELLVATCGTATTIDVISADGVFEGGMILPGLGTMMTSLALSTAQLPQVGEVAPPGAAFANNTVDAIVSGCVAAQAGAIEHALAERRRQRPGQPLRCVLAGGAAMVLAPYLATGDAALEKVDNLVLVGLHAAMTHGG
ncbi:type III pantothenate kinase [Herbaspirillum sp. LeCh32-8]|uniref:type III pantothenate kinase n=1 Tax=Herbaspirillum sp. LeCh32-8 TaxID=2821356 RepID=UPI001AE6DC86|nr:type III pantothenate kinase [Herbaspirillum sp. LeCh32-8]MBP0600360.1 type III pantothenate kinase [Herbaspirillum sp. LeCh32-8]